MVERGRKRESEPVESSNMAKGLRSKSEKKLRAIKRATFGAKQVRVRREGRERVWPHKLHAA